MQTVVAQLRGASFPTACERRPALPPACSGCTVGFNSPGLTWGSQLVLLAASLDRADGATALTTANCRGCVISPSWFSPLVPLLPFLCDRVYLTQSVVHFLLASSFILFYFLTSVLKSASSVYASHILLVLTIDLTFASVLMKNKKWND